MRTASLIRTSLCGSSHSLFCFSMLQKGAPMLDRIKTHLRTNKKYYLVGAGGVVLGAVTVVGTFYGMGGSIQIVDAYKLQINSPTTNNVWQVIEVWRKGPPSWVVRNTKTGKLWVSQSQAALADGHSIKQMSDHLRGKLPNLNGDVYERVALAAV